MTFEEILKYNAPYNQKIFDNIVTQIKSKNIVPYIGAGTSILSSDFYPTWEKFLTSTFHEYCSTNDIETFESLPFEKKADYLYDNIGKIAFSNHLKNIFNRENLNQPIEFFQEKSIYLIPLIFKKNLIVTTNYDKVIEEMYTLHKIYFDVSHPGHKESLNNVLRAPNQNLIFKIHGDISEPISSIILTTEQYNIAYNNQSFKKELGKVFQQKQLLFLGCGLGKDRPLELMKEILEDGFENFAIISCNEENLKNRRLELENTYNTQAIIYPEGQHQCLRIILEKILEKVNPEGYSSINFQKNISKEINRFKYNSETCDFHGRNNEIQSLTNFCTSSENFLWFSLSGDGGCGKTRLAWEFERLIKSKQIENMPNWNVVWNIPNHISMDTLIIIDYAKADSQRIATFIESEKSSVVKYRLLLIDRNNATLYKNIKLKMKSSSKLDETNYIEKSLNLNPIDDNNLKTIISSYIKKRGSHTENSDIENILNTCKRIDPTLKRPLYALFIADAFIESNDFLKWNQENVLEYVYNKYCHIINNGILNLFNRYNPIVQRNLFYIILFINFSEIKSLDKIKEILSHEINIISTQCENIGYEVEDFLRELDLLDTDNNLRIIEPHIIGEYFIIKELLKLKENSDEDILKFLYRSWSSTKLSGNVIKRLFNDFNDLLFEKNLNTYFENIRFPKEINIIVPEMFWGHQHIKSIEIHKNITEIGKFAFFACESLESIHVDIKNLNYSSQNGVLFNKNQSQLICYPKNKSIDEYVIPETVFELEDLAFSHSKNLKKIHLNNKIDTLPNLCFCEMKNLEKIIFNNSIKKIPSSCFNFCTSLKEIFIPANIIEIGDSAFNQCNNLEKIEVDPTNEIFFSHEGVLYNKKEKSLVTYPLGKKKLIYSIMEGTEIIEKQSFSNNNYIGKITIPNGVKNILEMAFSSCSNLQVVNIPNTVISLKSSTFSRCISLREITLSNSLEIIEYQQFIDCKSLEYIFIPNSIKKIETNAFYGCNSLKDIEINDSVEIIKSGCFSSCSSLEKIRLPKNLKKIEDYTFSYCDKLKDVILPDRVYMIDAYAFHGSNPLIHISKNNPYFLNKVNKFFSRFVDDLFSISYISTIDNSLLSSVYEIKGTHISKFNIKCNNPLYSADYWYKDIECKDKWNYESDLMPDKDIKLYAKVIKK